MQAPFFLIISDIKLSDSHHLLLQKPRNQADYEVFSMSEIWLKLVESP